MSKKRKNLILNILLAACIAVFLYCAVRLAVYYIQSFKYKKEIKKIAETIGGGIASDTVFDLENAQKNRDVLVFPDETAHELVGYVSHFSDETSTTWRDKYLTLTAQNQDCIGYIEIPDTLLSLPVMFTPYQYDKYLDRGFDLTYDYRGLPFMDAATVIGQSRNYLLYGHNMVDGTSFGSLRNYRDKSYCEEHPYVYFNTSVSEGIYQVMFVSRTKVYKQTDNAFRYYRYGGVLNETQFNTYIQEMGRMSLYSTGVTAQWGDELLSLSTCDHYIEDGRLVIVCKRIQ